MNAPWLHLGDRRDQRLNCQERGRRATREPRGGRRSPGGRTGRESPRETRVKVRKTTMQEIAGTLCLIAQGLSPRTVYFGSRGSPALADHLPDCHSASRADPYRSQHTRRMYTQWLPGVFHKVSDARRQRVAEGLLGGGIPPARNALGSLTVGIGLVGPHS